MATAKKAPAQKPEVKNTTTVITKTKEKFESSRNLTGDFQLDGYSSYDAMTNFINGTYKVTDGEMISDFNSLL